MQKLLTILISVLIFMFAATAQAAPSKINYQGRLTDDAGNPVADGTYNMTFKIYSDPDGIGEEWSSGILSVQVENGLFNVILSGITAYELTPDLDYYMGITVGLNPEMRPLVPLASAPFALKAEKAEAVYNGAIDNAAINVNANIDPSKIEDTAAVVGLQRFNTFHNPNIFKNMAQFEAQIFVLDWSLPDAMMYFYDSTMRVNSTGIKIGTDDDPAIHSPLIIERHYNTNSPSSRYGSLAHVYNAGTGMLCANWNKAQKTTATPTTEYTYGVYGNATNDHQIGTTQGVFGYASGGIDAHAIHGYAADGQFYNWAGYFDGDAMVTGTFYDKKSAFRIDHPLDPENKYLCHSSVTSPDMKNVYDGVVTLDDNGKAVVTLPDYFEALNKDFRYQLTCIGSYAPIYISEKIDNNQFEIAGGEPGMEISWQVTGIRKDPYAEDSRISVEVDKFDHEKGLYLYPEGYGYGEEKSINYESRQQAIELTKGGGGD